MKTDIRSEKGFTLVELAVVMIIIGLLIGGVLKGQELIKSAKVTSTISQVKGIDAATSTFQDIYAALPGDLRGADTRLPGCTTNVCGATNAVDLGNGRVSASGTNAPFVSTDNSEARAFFAQLASADLLSGVSPSDVAIADDAFSQNYPQAPVGGGWYASTVIAEADLPGDLDGNVTDFRSGLYIMHQQLPNDVATQASNALTMQRIDRKIDDGNPLSGSVYGAEQTQGDCLSVDASAGTTDNAYDTASSGLACNAIIRIQN